MIAYTKDKPKLKLVIKEDPNVGYYLVVYPKGSSRSLADFLCDSLEEALSQAEEDYKIPRSAWSEYEEEQGKLLEKM